MLTYFLTTKRVFIMANYNFDTSNERSSHMKKIKSQNTIAEILLRKKLWSCGIRFRINNKLLIGRPDIAIKKYKLVVFVDGEFWHGYNWDQKKLRIKANKDYWIPKIERNMRRDENVNLHYLNNGWIILRFWEKEIKTDLNGCVTMILECLGRN